MEIPDPIISHKRGDTFAYAGSLELPAGTWTGAAQLRIPRLVGGLTPAATIAVVVTPPIDPETASGIRLHAPAIETAVWPLGVLLCDVQFTDGSDPPVVLSTRTFAVEIVPDVTRV